PRPRAPGGGVHRRRDVHLVPDPQPDRRRRAGDRAATPAVGPGGRLQRAGAPALLGHRLSLPERPLLELRPGRGRPERRRLLPEFYLRRPVPDGARPGIRALAGLTRDAHDRRTAARLPGAVATPGEPAPRGRRQVARDLA